MVKFNVVFKLALTFTLYVFQFNELEMFSYTIITTAKIKTNYIIFNL